MVDQLSGSDMAAKLNACIALGPNVICDATAITGSQSLTSATVNCNQTNTTILLGTVTITSSLSPIFNLSANRCALRGMPAAATTIILTSSATADVIQVPCSSCDVENLSIASTNGTTRTAGAGINLTGGAATIANIKLAEIWNGILNQGQGEFTNIEYGTPGGSFGGLTLGTGNNSGIYVGPTACCTTSSNYTNLAITSDWTIAGIVVDSGSDSQNFTNLQMSCGVNSTNIRVMNSLAGYNPTLIAFNNGAVEACGSGSSIRVDACSECTFSNIHSGCSGTICTNGLLLASGGIKHFAYLGGAIQNTNQESVKITGSSATDIKIIGTLLTDGGQLTNNTYPSIGIAGGVSGVTITDNTFANFKSPGNIPSNNVNIGSGSGGNIFVGGNTWGDNSGTPISNNSSLTTVRIWQNVGSGSNNVSTDFAVMDGSVSGTILASTTQRQMTIPYPITATRLIVILSQSNLSGCSTAPIWSFTDGTHSISCTISNGSSSCDTGVVSQGLNAGDIKINTNAFSGCASVTNAEVTAMYTK